MKNFKFQLEPVLQHRENNEQQAALAQASAHQKYLSQLSCLNKTRMNLETSLQTELSGDCFDVLHNTMYRQWLKNKVIQEEKSADTAYQKFKKCRQKTLEARKQKLILEKLKENQFATHVERQNKAEQKQFDELATQVTLRHQSNPFQGSEGGDLE
ncbi:MAG: flagellar export protein FliJ [Firmicutes bacterium]|nr:flagellar export protein FliJ [Bacillota bacterium]